METEDFAARVKRAHRLSSLHIFDAPDGWAVFGFRTDAKGFQASVENGRGETIRDAIRNLDQRLIAGPVKAREM